MSMKIVYWGIKARASLPVLIARVGGLDLTWDQTGGNWPEYKPLAPFGQLPVLEVGDLKIGQSLAIVRFLARKAGLQGKSDADFAVSEMLIQEFEDILSGMSKANYVPDADKVAAWTKFRDVTAPHHLGNLEKLLPAGSAFFTTEGPTAGDLAAYMALSFVLDVNKQALAAFPKLAAFFKHVETLPGVQTFLAKDSVPTYFSPKFAEPLVLRYWGIKARGSFPALLARVGKVDLVWDQTGGNWPEYKAQAPFGQLPVLEVGGQKIAQSLAIARYVSRLGGLEGKSDADYAMSEMLIQEFEDVYGGMAKANYVPDADKVASWTKFRDETLPKHLGNLEKLLPAGSAFFTTEGPTAGDLAAYLAISFALDVNADALDAFPKLAAFYKHVETLPGTQEYLAKDSVPTYFKPTFN